MLAFKKILYIFICFVLFQTAKAQNVAHVNKDSLPYALKRLWKYNTSDNPEFAKPTYNDAKWLQQRSFLSSDEIGDSIFKGFAWFRIHLTIPDSLKNKTLAVDILQNGASEIFVDGKKIASYGKISFSGKDEKRFNPYGIVIPVIFNDDSVHVIAVRYSNHKYKQDIKWEEFDAGFMLTVDIYSDQTFKTIESLATLNLVLLTVSGFLAALTFIHFFFFIFYRKQKHHLYYSVFTFFFSLFFFLPYFSLNTFDPDISAPIIYFIPVVIPAYLIALAGFIYYLILDKLPRFFWLNILLGVIIISGFFFKTGHNDIFYALLIGVVITQSFSAIGTGVKQKKDGVKIIMWGVITFFSLIGLIGISYLIELMGFHIGGLYISSNSSPFIVVPLIFILLSVPISISLYMARSFSTLNVSLEKKLVEVEELSAKSIEQEKERQLILANQNVVLEKQVKERTLQLSEVNEELQQQNEEIASQRDEIELQKHKVEEHQKEIIDSITYAKRLQEAILPSRDFVTEYLPENFILYKPKDLVAGDFYWMEVLPTGEHLGATILIAAADSTGHGVPGAMVSVVCSNALNRSLKEFNLTEPGQLLDKTRELVLETFSKSSSEVKDGMDISLLSIEFPSPVERACPELAEGDGRERSEIIVKWSGANNSLWYLLPGATSLSEIKPNKQPIGKTDNPTSFTTHTISLPYGEGRGGATFYLFTDGYADQFGGPKGKKFKYKQFEELLLANAHLNMNEQCEILESKFEDWKGNLEQVDDVCIIGIRL